MLAHCCSEQVTTTASHHYIACRQCALALCTTLDSTLQPIAGRLSLHIHSDLCSTSRRTSVQHLQTLVQDSLPDTAIQATASTVAVLYTLIVAATTQLQASLSSRCTAVNLLISSLSILLSTADIKQEPATVWQTWQSLLWAVGLDSCHVCAVLNPTCKATLIRLQTAATQPCLSVKLKARVFLLLLIFSTAPVKPCYISRPVHNKADVAHNSTLVWCCHVFQSKLISAHTIATT